MITSVRRWGNSLAVRLPKAYVSELSMAEGAAVDVSVKDGALILRPVAQRRYELTELLGGITNSNLHAEADGGPSVGREEW